MKVMALDDVPGVVKEGQGDSGREVDAVPKSPSGTLFSLDLQSQGCSRCLGIFEKEVNAPTDG